MGNRRWKKNNNNNGKDRPYNLVLTKVDIKIYVLNYILYVEKFGVQKIGDFDK